MVLLRVVVLDRFYCIRENFLMLYLLADFIFLSKFVYIQNYPVGRVNQSSYYNMPNSVLD